MKVIVRDMAKLGSQYDTDVFRFRENIPAIDQLRMLVDTDIEWLEDEAEDKEIYDDEAHIFSKEYVIHYYICEVQDYYMLPKEKKDGEDTVCIK